jgi:hypothetical protein
MIFSDTAREKPKKMGFGKFDFSMRGSNAHQIARVGSPPGASHCDSHSIVDHFIDITMQVGEGSSDSTSSIAEAPSTPARIRTNRLPRTSALFTNSVAVLSLLCPEAAPWPPPIFSEPMIFVFMCVFWGRCQRTAVQLCSGARCLRNWRKPRGLKPARAPRFRLNW